MPKAFFDSGYIFGIFGVILMGFLCNLCIHMLVQINELLMTKPEQIPCDYQDIYHLSMGSMIANFVQWASLLIILYNLVTNIPYIGDRKPINYRLPQFVNNAIISFNERSKVFAKPFGVLNMAILFVIILYSSVGFLGYLKYGDNVGASITFSLPNEPLYIWLYNLCMHLQLHFPIRLQMFVAIHPASIPELDLIIELIGAFACTSVAIIIPTILHLIAFYERTDGFLTTTFYWYSIFITKVLLKDFKIDYNHHMMYDDLLTPSFNEDNNIFVRMPFWFDKLIN
ncbi:hypothetical protein DERP_012430 [Dermatophagoides pteronyssinus]|uniref:Amino acid transporter transmembrane domain-containing protein n=1 Tax=Dermatophagoides pteronyssinus TaxID=6956 RepID=A0ABQ8IXL6_DERPT|nr:hypothetical protein DERP_012430 [Dermatophagoides pteronyssinus]